MNIWIINIVFFLVCQLFYQPKLVQVKKGVTCNTGLKDPPNPNMVERLTKIETQNKKRYAKVIQVVANLKHISWDTWTMQKELVLSAQCLD